MKVEDVAFESGPARCAGRAFLPETGARPFPAVLLCHGFAGTMDRLQWHAEQFARAGILALVFDYRHFGLSGGEPRQLVSVPRQLEDIRAAKAHLRGRADVDPSRIALWGNSLGGGLVCSIAAEDHDIAAVVAQVPFNGFPRGGGGRSSAAILRLLLAILSDAVRGLVGLPPKLIKLVGRPEELAVIVSPDAAEHTQTVFAGGTTMRNEVAPRGLLGMMRYRPSDTADRIACPLLVCVAQDDRETPPELARPLAKRAPKGEFRMFPGSHMRFYDPNAQVGIIAEQIDFLRRHLALTSSLSGPA
jgi:dienelactone hydrolase